MGNALDMTLTAREVSFVAAVGYEAVTKAFERRRVAALTDRPRRRCLDVRGAFSFAVDESLKLYPASVRKRIGGEVARRLQAARRLEDIDDVRVTDPLVETTFRASELARSLGERLETLGRLRGAVVTDDAVQAGAPVFRGTRVLVRHIAGLVRNGIERREIAEDFPEISDELIDLAVLFEKLHPRRGRPLLRGTDG